MAWLCLKGFTFRLALHCIQRYLTGTKKNKQTNKQTKNALTQNKTKRKRTRLKEINWNTVQQ